MAGRLLLIGIGISDERGISLAGLEALRACDKIYAERYTNFMPEGTLSRLEKLCGKGITVLSREAVEGEKEILESAKDGTVALVVAGDPMIATTHVSLLLAAKKRGIATEVIHSSSILSAAIGESGLQAYKFGKTVTLAYWRDNYRPMSAYDVISENLARGLHTLLLLDIDEKLGPMKPSAAADVLLKMEAAGKKGIILPSTKLVLLKGMGWQSPTRAYCALSELGKYDAKDGPAVLIVPAKLHFLEEEFLSLL
ncbi:MAG: diphthine synthase [Candidatus Micrarchaeota archaeon]|nr:diphthine synthase [Candidatus Micrarchaeota archaeon]